MKNHSKSSSEVTNVFRFAFPERHFESEQETESSPTFSQVKVLWVLKINNACGNSILLPVSQMCTMNRRGFSQSVKGKQSFQVPIWDTNLNKIGSGVAIGRKKNWAQ